jgi:hypothetical protein
VKAISLWQPWASLWLSPRKIHETRHWSISVPKNGVWMAVHAAKRPEKRLDPQLLSIVRADFGDDWFDKLPRGAVIGRVWLTGCVRINDALRTSTTIDDLVCGNFATGRFGWKRSTFEALKEPVPYRGLQGMFSVPDDFFPAPHIEFARRA